MTTNGPISRWPRPELLARLEGLELQARRIVDGTMSGLHQSHTRGFSIEFAEHRQYTPGDDPRLIDWKVYGRSNRYTVKQFEAETNFLAHILVDCSESMLYGSNPRQTKWHFATELAAAIAWIVLLQRDAFSMSAYAAECQTLVSPSGSPATFRAACHALEQLKPTGVADLGNVLHRFVEKVPRRGLIILIGDFFDDVDTFLDGVKHARFRGHEVIAWHVMDPREVDFAFDGPIRLIDLEQGGIEPIDPRRIAEAYRSEVESFRTELETRLRLLGQTYEFFRTDQPIERLLGEFLRRRRRLA